MLFIQLILYLNLLNKFLNLSFVNKNNITTKYIPTKEGHLGS